MKMRLLGNYFVCVCVCGARLCFFVFIFLLLSLSFISISVYRRKKRAWKGLESLIQQTKSTNVGELRFKVAPKTHMSLYAHYGLSWDNIAQVSVTDREIGCVRHSVAFWVSREKERAREKLVN